jgi:chemotaxis protein CheX
MEVDDLKVFLQGTARYFEKTLNEPCDVDPPYLQGSDKLVLDYTGMIGITGRERGAVYFTASASMLHDMLHVLAPTDMADLDRQFPNLPANLETKTLKELAMDEVCLDIVGEIANTIAGNSREQFGQEFNISVPVRLKIRAEQLHFPKNTRTFVIPLTWRTHRAYLLICLE